MKYVLAVLAMCLCLAGCWTPPTTSNVTNNDKDGTAYLVGVGYTLPDSTGFLGGTELTYTSFNQRPEVRWPSMFDFGPQETPLSYRLAWDLARSNARDSEAKRGADLDYNVDWDIGEFTPLIRDLFPRHQWDY